MSPKNLIFDLGGVLFDINYKNLENDSKLWACKG